MSAARDLRLLYATAFLRALATGLMGILLGFYLAELRLGAGAMGIIVAAGLAGATVATLVVSVAGDRLGHRRVLLVLALATAAGGAALALTSHPLVLGIAAFLGMANGMGRDRGAALVVEQAVLPVTVADDRRTFAFASYNVAQDIGHAVGGLLAGVTGLIVHVGGGRVSDLGALRWSLGLYVLLALAPLLLYARLSPAVEGGAAATAAAPVSPATRRMLWKICSLFALDSIGGGFLTTALLSYFFHERFGVGIGVVGGLFFLSRVANAVSHFGAAWLARRIGLVNTMVFTHIPSSLLLVTVAYAPTFPIAAALFLLREGLVEMDVPTRQSYVMAVVRPEERTFASGVTHVVRLGAWAVAPSFAGLLMARGSMITPLLVGAVMKIAYDIMLWQAFRHTRPPEEIQD